MERDIKDLLMGQVRGVREIEESRLDPRFLSRSNYLGHCGNYQDREHWERNRSLGIEIKSCVFEHVKFETPRRRVEQAVAVGNHPAWFQKL